MKKTNGFTIVELLIVIVVIGILAAIIITAYNGVQSRAKLSSAQSTAENAVKRAENYYVEKSVYPTISTDLTGASATGMTYLVTGVNFIAAMGTTPPAAPASLTFYKCGTGATTAAPTTVAGVTTITGTRFDYFNFSTSTTTSVSAGITSGVIATYNVGCAVNN
jgi:type IV pilus assembly protein PilA